MQQDPAHALRAPSSKNSRSCAGSALPAAPCCLSVTVARSAASIAQSAGSVAWSRRLPRASGLGEECRPMRARPCCPAVAAYPGPRQGPDRSTRPIQVCANRPISGPGRRRSARRRDWRNVASGDHGRITAVREHGATSPTSFVGTWSETLTVAGHGTTEAPQRGAGVRIDRLACGDRRHRAMRFRRRRTWRPINRQRTFPPIRRNRVKPCRRAWKSGSHPSAHSQNRAVLDARSPPACAAPARSTRRQLGDDIDGGAERAGGIERLRHRRGHRRRQPLGVGSLPPLH